MEILARSILSVDTISKGNDKPWNIILDYMRDNNVSENIIFDFKGIEIVCPWVSDSFMKLMSNPLVGLRIYNNQMVVDTINKACLLNGYPVGRVENVKPTIKVTETREEKEIADMAEQLQAYFETNGDSAIFHMYKRFDQIGMPKTVTYLVEAIKKFHKNSGISDIMMYTKYATIQSGVLKLVAEMVGKMKLEGIDLDIKSDDNATANKLAICNSSPNGEYSEEDKVSLIRNRMTPGKVGMLIKYRATKGRDEFGRSGKGEAVFNRVAIFNKLYKDKAGKWKVQVTSYPNPTFTTRANWYLEHDGEIVDKLPGETIDVEVSEFGMYNDFIGSHYHFITPVQYKPEHSQVLYGTRNDGSVYSEDVTIPELAKKVFTDFEIKFDEKTLDAYIEKTKEILKGID